MAVFLFGFGRLRTFPLAVGCVALGLVVALLGRHGHKHEHGLMVIDSYARRSRLYARNPVCKTLFATSCALLCVAGNSVLLSLFFFLSMLGISVGLGGLSLRGCLRLFAIPAAFILLGSLALLVEFSPVPTELLSIPIGGSYLVVTRASQLRALSVTARAFGAISCLNMLSLSTPMDQLIGVLRRLRVPAVLVELMYLMYRYIFVMLETYVGLRTAANARLGFRSFARALSTTLQSAGSLFFLSFRRALDSFVAMESRCYDGDLRFLELPPAACRQELLFAAVYLAVTAALFVMGRGFGL